MKQLFLLFALLIVLLPIESEAYLGGGLATGTVTGGYTGTETIVIQGSKVSTVSGTTLTNFPVLIYGTYTYLKTTANSGSIQNTTTLNTQTVPADLIFTSDSGCTTKLNWEVSSYTATTGAIEAWVNVASLPPSNTTIYMCYGNAAVTTYQGNATSAWNTNYKGVFHLANGSALSVRDSTSNSNNGTNTGTSASSSGQIDGAGSFNGTSNNISVGTTGIPSGNNAYTLSAWITAANLTQTGRFIGFGSNAVNELTNVGINANGFIQIAHDGNTSTNAASAITANVLNYVSVTYNGTTETIYLNGSSIYSWTPGPLNNTIGSAYIGNNGTASNQNWAGIIDEAHFVNTALSPDWVVTEYNNQSSPSTFYTITP
jgi:Concanavalin A-like lectin/glucanases superfamily/Domain of unknown function (DUF2341)